MKLKILRNALLLLLSTVFVTSAGMAGATVDYQKSTPFDSGKWIKFKISDTGIYEISYAELSEMGFSDPSKVGVCGGSSTPLDINFFDETGKQLYSDALHPIGVIHSTDRMYVYLTGASAYEFVADSSYLTKGYFHRKSKNIYTDTPSYFLTDSHPYVTEAPHNGVSSAGATTIYGGAGFIAHEADIYHNDSNSGQLFWGESLNDGHSSRHTWNYSLSCVDLMTPAVMECEIYIDQASDPAATYGYGAVGGTRNFSSPVKKYNFSNHYPQRPTASAIMLPGKSGQLYAEYNSVSNRSGVANVDFWTLTYSRTSPSLTDCDGRRMAQEEFLINTLNEGKTGLIVMDVPAGTLALDITDPLAVATVTLNGTTGNMRGAVSNNGAYPRLVVFDPSLEQKKIMSPSPVVSTSLHSKAAERADMLIITTPDYRQHADRLAAIHAAKEGLKVIVADVEDIYNEFSAGNPDPMAYRALTRMLWQSDMSAISNVLLFGPVSNDMRRLVSHGGSDTETLIAYQSVNTTIESGAYNINDIHGMMTDYINPANPAVYPLEIGVGVLPFANTQEAKTFVDKIDSYLNTTDHSRGVNDNCIVAGLYDKHMHGVHALNIYDVVYRGKHGDIIPEVVSIDAYGEKNARARFISALDRGASVLSYMGHGAQTMLGKNTNFFAMPDAMSLKNRTHPFLTVAGCEISNFDRGERGIGEAMALSTRHGAIGSLIATRDTWAMQNLALIRNFYLALYKTGSNPTPSSPDITTPQTIGQIYARAKTSNVTENKFAYQLVADPALRIATATRGVDVKVPVSGLIPGQMVEIKFTVLDADGKPDTDYNGTATCKLMGPIEQRESKDLVTNTLKEDGVSLKVYYTDNYATASTDVKDGSGKFRMLVPYNTASKTGSEFTVHVGTFDSDSWIGAAGKAKGQIRTSGQSGITQDRTNPTITLFEYDADLNVLRLEVSDNHGFYTGDINATDYLRVTLDGQILSDATAFPPTVTSDGLGMIRIIPLRSISRGEHSARVTVKDCAGNQVSAETIFSTDRPMADVRLQLQGEAAWTKALFKVEGSYNSNSRIVITDAEGRRVAVRAIRGEEVSWNLSLDDGGKASPGLYKAYVEVTANNGTVTVSEKIDVPVV